MPGPGSHPGQPVHPGAPQQVGQDRLGLVVGGVAGGGVRPENRPAGLSGPGLQIGPVVQLHPFGPEPCAEPTGRIGNHVGLPPRPGAESVVDVDRGYTTAPRHRPRLDYPTTIRGP